MTSYRCNKGVNRPIEFRGLQAQYIWYVAAVVIIGMLLFALLHLCGVSSWVCLPLVGTLGGAGVIGVYRMSRKYGTYGLGKRRAARRIPAALRSRSRLIFQQSIQHHEKRTTTR